ncbi:hypothetical protein FGG08_007243 [Glutinoglossum americanum]|uniref:Uncharacterized protein n=1 Tax=Glutinoglossum americanum TaxID=1670608 RepID=A0A9P8L095_9PEZI|nr:hypothetical protein FGG08_007243 [Glutinoglossum americanum]
MACETNFYFNYERVLMCKNDIVEGRAKPRQYFTLTLISPYISRSPNIIDADRALKCMITQPLVEFHDTYAAYLGRDAPKAIDPTDPAHSLTECVQPVKKAIRDARQRGDKTLAGVNGIHLFVGEYDAFSNDYLEP